MTSQQKVRRTPEQERSYQRELADRRFRQANIRREDALNKVRDASDLESLKTALVDILENLL